MSKDYSYEERPRGRSNGDARSLKSIILISRKHDLDPRLLVDALNEAWKKKVSKYGSFMISCRDVGRDGVSFLLTKEDKVVSQFPVRLDFLKDTGSLRSMVREVDFSDYLKAKPLQRQRKIAELRFGMKKVDVTGKVVDIPPKRLVTSEFGNQFYVSNVKIADATGSVKLSLWNGQIDKVHVGDVVDVKDCYVANSAGEPQLRIGRNGTISVVTV
jgi:replication factor A1